GREAACGEVRAEGVLSPIELAEREEAIATWLLDHGLDPAIADALSETTITVDALERVAAGVDAPALGAALRSIGFGCSMRSLASEIQEAAMRISALVLAVRGFTHMDQAAVAEPVDLVRSLGSTI